MRGPSPHGGGGAQAVRLQIRVLTLLCGTVLLSLALYFGAFNPLLKRVNTRADHHAHSGHSHERRARETPPALDAVTLMDRDMLVAVLTAMIPKEGLSLDNIERALDILMHSGQLPSKAQGAAPYSSSAAMLARPIRVVQVGANDGGNANDPINSRLNATEGMMQVAMLEPVPFLFDILSQRVKSTPRWSGVTPIWGASCPEGSGKTHPFYAFRRNATEYTYMHTRMNQLMHYSESVFQIGSFHKRHLMHNSGSTEEDLENVLEVHQVPCHTLASIMCKQGWEYVDYFHVDAEGTDDQVVYTAQLEVTRPFVVRLEAQHIEGSLVEKFLTDLGYFVLRTKAHGVAEILGIWSNLKNLPPKQLECPPN